MFQEKEQQIQRLSDMIMHDMFKELKVASEANSCEWRKEFISEILKFYVMLIFYLSLIYHTEV